VIWIDVKPAFVAIEIEINGYTRRYGDAVVLTWRQCLGFIVLNAMYWEQTGEFRPPWLTDYKTITCSLQMHSNSQSLSVHQLINHIAADSLDSFKKRLELWTTTWAIKASAYPSS